MTNAGCWAPGLLHAELLSDHPALAPLLKSLRDSPSVTGVPPPPAANPAKAAPPPPPHYDNGTRFHEPRGHELPMTAILPPYRTGHMPPAMSCSRGPAPCTQGGAVTWAPHSIGGPPAYCVNHMGYHVGGMEMGGFPMCDINDRAMDTACAPTGAGPIDPGGMAYFGNVTPRHAFGHNPFPHGGVMNGHAYPGNTVTWPNMAEGVACFGNAGMPWSGNVGPPGLPPPGWGPHGYPHPGTATAAGGIPPYGRPGAFGVPGLGGPYGSPICPRSVLVAPSPARYPHADAQLPLPKHNPAGAQAGTRCPQLPPHATSESPGGSSPPKAGRKRPLADCGASANKRAAEKLRKLIGRRLQAPDPAHPSVTGVTRRDCESGDVSGGTGNQHEGTEVAPAVEDRTKRTSVAAGDQEGPSPTGGRWSLPAGEVPACLKVPPGLLWPSLNPFALMFSLCFCWMLGSELALSVVAALNNARCLRRGWRCSSSIIIPVPVPTPVPIPFPVPLPILLPVSTVSPISDLHVQSAPWFASPTTLSLLLGLQVLSGLRDLASPSSQSTAVASSTFFFCWLQFGSLIPFSLAAP